MPFSCECFLCHYGGQLRTVMLKVTIIEITSKLDHNIPDLEVNLPEYDILCYDRNRNGVACCYQGRIYVLRIQ